MDAIKNADLNAYDSRDDSEKPYNITLWPRISLNGLPFNADRPTVFITHGFLSNGNETWMDDLKDAYIMQVCKLSSFSVRFISTWTLLYPWRFFIHNMIGCSFFMYIFKAIVMVFSIKICTLYYNIYLREESSEKWCFFQYRRWIISIHCISIKC